MASMSRLGTGLVRRSGLLTEPAAVLRCPACLHRPVLLPRAPSRPPSLGGRRPFSQQSQQRPRFSSRLRMALGKSKTEWYFIPVGVGIGFLGLVQGYKVYTREKERQEGEEAELQKKPKRRPRIRPDGPWYVRYCRTAAMCLS